MKTVTLKIHGRDIEFTDEPPTRAGNHYWWNGLNTWGYSLVTVTSDPERGLIATGDSIDDPVQSIGGLWSAPLVPVTEVERAYREGMAGGLSAGKPLHVTNLWKASVARRVVEGLE